MSNPTTRSRDTTDILIALIEKIPGAFNDADSKVVATKAADAYKVIFAALKDAPQSKNQT